MIAQRRTRCRRAPLRILLAGLLAVVVLAGCGSTTSSSSGGGAPKTKPVLAPLPNNHLVKEHVRRKKGKNGYTVPNDKGVAVYPYPGTQYNLPRQQIAFRGIASAELAHAQITVTGSKTGPHHGHIKADSDGRGGSFLPDKPFARDETVTVKTNLQILGVTGGNFSFKIGRPGKPIKAGDLREAAIVSGGVDHFRSAPSVEPATMQVLSNTAPALGDIFVAPQNGPIADGPMIMSAGGGLIWFHGTPVSQKLLTTDFRVQRLHGQRVLTYFQGSTNRGSGRGVGVILNDHYQQIATVHAANGLDVDLHEFLLTGDGDAWVISASPMMLPGSVRPIIDSVVQEIDIKTGLVLFEWHSLDHVPVSDSYKYLPSTPGHVLDPFHMNAVTPMGHGAVAISDRNTSAMYKLNMRTGDIVWTMGGKHPTLKMGPGTTTAFQHDLVYHGAGLFTIFDNGAGPPKVHSASRGLTVKVSQKRGTVTLLRSLEHAPPVSAALEGSVQLLPDHETLMGFGQQPYVAEFNAEGQQDLNAKFITSNNSYRAYRFPWVGKPLTKPAVAASASSGGTTVWASWNGATQVASWRVVGGASPKRLRRIGAGVRSGFETAINVPATRYVAVEALNANNQVIGSSKPIPVG